MTHVFHQFLDKRELVMSIRNADRGVHGVVSCVCEVRVCMGGRQTYSVYRWFLAPSNIARKSYSYNLEIFQTCPQGHFTEP